MTRAQAGDSALKLLAAATVVSLGVMTEDVCEKTVSLLFTTHMPLLAPFAPQVAAVLVASLTGIASALLVYAIDRLDIFGVRRQRTHEQILHELEAAIVDSDAAIDGMFDAEMNQFEAMVTLG